MTVLKYVLTSKVCSTGELLSYKRQDPKGYATFVEMAKGEMVHNGISVEEATAKA